MTEQILAIIHEYISEIQKALGSDFIKAVVYGSYARGDFNSDSDIDIAVFTSRRAEEFYLLIEKIAEITFEYSVKYDLIFSPVFQNEQEFNRMLKFVPYYQSIQREGVLVG